MESEKPDSNISDAEILSSDLELLKNKARLLDSLHDCVYLVDADHKVLAVNAQVLSMLNTAHGDLTGWPIQRVFKELADGEGRSFDIGLPVSRALTSGDAELLDGWCSHDQDGSNGEPHGEPHKVAVSVFPPSAGSGAETVTIVVGHTVSGQAYRLRDAVLSMVSHELRTPLLHIKGFVSSLLESDIEWDEATRLDFLHTIDREADRLTSTVSDLMEISRMGSGDLPLHIESADPYLLAYAALDSASLFANKHQVIIEVPEKLPKIRVDVLRVMGVLVNLIENATKYSDEGTKIVIDAVEEDGNIRFSVADYGMGIPADSLTRIFNMFYRGEFGGKRSSGTGLGLAVCKSVLDAHKGQIWVESEVGKGSTFHFTVPIKQNRRKKATKPVKRASSKTSSTRNGARIKRSAKSTIRSKVSART